MISASRTICESADSNLIKRNTGDAREGFSLGIHSLSAIIHEPGHDATGVPLRHQWQHALMIKTQPVKTIYARFMEFSFSLLVIFPDHGKMVWGEAELPRPQTSPQVPGYCFYP
jgi:hypothetical protein